MLTEKQRQIFDRLLDANYYMNRESDLEKKDELFIQVCLLKKELKEDMGEELYTQFMNTGMRMFRPKDQDVSNSFSEGICPNMDADKHLKSLDNKSKL